jgi:hypothetical protein
MSDNEIQILQMPKFIDSGPWQILEFLQSSQYEGYFLMRNIHYIHPKQHTIQHLHWEELEWPLIEIPKFLIIPLVINLECKHYYQI